MLNVYSAAGNIIGLLSTKNLGLPPTHILAHHNVDQLILYHPETLHLRIYNYDGSIAKQCGNGLRALGFHLNKPQIVAWLPESSHIIQNLKETWVHMGMPCIKQNNEDFKIPHTILNIGNDHLIVWGHPICDTFIQTNCQTYNISFASSLSTNRIHLRTYERGVGWTQACGSAAASTAFLAHSRNPHITDWSIISPGGELINIITAEGVLQSGPIEKVYESLV